MLVEIIDEIRQKEAYTVLKLTCAVRGDLLGVRTAFSLLCIFGFVEEKKMGDRGTS